MFGCSRRRRMSVEVTVAQPSLRGILRDIPRGADGALLRGGAPWRHAAKLRERVQGGRCSGGDGHRGRRRWRNG